MSTGAPDTFCNININNKQSTNWGQLGDEDLESIVNGNNYSNLTTTIQQQQQQQQQTTIPTHDAVRRSSSLCVCVCVCVCVFAYRLPCLQFSISTFITLPSLSSSSFLSNRTILRSYIHHPTNKHTYTVRN
jgi:hypothetical protein